MEFEKRTEITPAELATNDQHNAVMREEIRRVVNSIAAHKASGCDHTDCPGSELVDFMTVQPTGRALWMALQMMAEEVAHAS